MGAYVGTGGTLREASKDNPKGFWERNDVRTLHQKVLKTMGASWHEIAHFDLSKLTKDDQKEFGKKARRILQRLDVHRPWVLKDPQMCLLLPLWRPLLEAPICIHIYRRPLQVAQSLRTRNGFPIHFGVALWEQYTLAALANSRHLPRLFVAHHRLLAQPLETVRALYEQLLALDVHGLRLPSEREILAFLEPALYRERGDASLEKEFINFSQEALFQALEEGTSSLFDGACSLSAGAQAALASHDIEERRERQRRADMEPLQQQLTEAERVRVALEHSKTAEVNALRQRLTEAEQMRVVEVRTLQQQRTELERSLATAREQLVALEQSKAAEGTRLQHKLIESERLLASREQQLSVRTNELRQSARDSARLLGWISQLDRAFVSVINSQRWRLGHALAVLYRKIRFKPPLPMPQDYVNNLREEIRIWRGDFDKRNLIAPMEMTPNKEVAARAEAVRNPRELLTPMEMTPNREVAAPAEAVRTPQKVVPPMQMGPGAVKKSMTPAGMEPGKISVIILNRNGAVHLQNLFASVWALNTYRNVEFLVVDHASSDQSLGVLQAWQPHLPLAIIACDQNYSFSYSNNEAAKKASGQYLFFLNNDIIFDNDVLPLLLAKFHDSEPEVGVVGVRLVYPSHHETAPHQVQHGGVKFSQDIPHGFYRPYELGVKAHTFSGSAGSELVPVVTGAALLCQRDEFLSIGGFCEEYFYGYEDVDLCLSYVAQRHKVSRCVTDTQLIHDEGATRRLEGRQERSARIRSNQGILQKRYGYAIKKAVQIDMVQGTSFWTDDELVVAFAVTEAHEQAKAGDYFTAAELAVACATQCGWQVKFLVRNQDWYDLDGVDILIVMIDAYDLTQIARAKPTLVKIAWLRNWFERWGQRPCFDAYDMYLCSSQKGAQFIKDHHGKQPHVFRIATNERRFMPGSEREEYRADYCFTGSYWNAARDIESVLDPARLDYQFALYGNGWDTHDKFRPYWKGFVPYKELPLVYTSTKVVIDDANHVTRPWASVNSRVFDALASGALVITNGDEGANEVFAEKLPTYHDGRDLHSLLDRYLNDEEARRALVADLRKTVLDHHTYTHRAAQFQSLLVDFRDKKFRIALKVPVPRMEVAQEWGDYHFALALKRALVKHGHAVRIDILPDWDTPRGFGDDVVLVLRGLSQYVPKPEHINIIWNISHPDKVSEQEYEQYDHVFIASRQYADHLRKTVKTPVSALLQCTDPNLFYPDAATGVPAEPVLFVGNSRKQLRTIVKDALAADLPLAIYGTLWEGLVPPRYVKGTHIENTELRRYYSTCKVLLNDHWPLMREQGFISNRIFDAGACGTLVVTDEVIGLETVFGDTVVAYRDATDLKRVVDHFGEDEGARREKGERLREIVLRDHTFDHRAATILEVITEIDRRKRFAAVGATTGGRSVVEVSGEYENNAEGLTLEELHEAETRTDI
jgi:spore maturation protein CgeB/GT2 family glycosyltransferase